MNDLARLVEEQGPWYHTIELPGGVVTEALYDLRGVPRKLPIPASLAGKRCLDAASNDGFWAFELASRGADEVVSLDLEDPGEKDWQGLHTQEQRSEGVGLTRGHFELVREALGADNTKRVDMNLYDITPETLGTFDYVFIGSVLLHLADPARALRALRTVIAPGGEMLSFEAISFTLSVLSPKIPLGQLWEQDFSRWWTPNMAGHRRLVQAAGFEILDHGGPVFQPFGPLVHKNRPKGSRKPRLMLFNHVVRRFGCASAWVRAAPKADPV